MVEMKGLGEETPQNQQQEQATEKDGFPPPTNNNNYTGNPIGNLMNMKNDIMDSFRGGTSKDLLIAKTFYFFFFSAFGSLFPLMAVYFKQMGMNPTQGGLLIGVRPFVEFLAAPFWGSMADRFRKGKIMLLFSLGSWIIFTLALAFIQPPASSCMGQNDTHHALGKMKVKRSIPDNYYNRPVEIYNFEKALDEEIKRNEEHVITPVSHITVEVTTLPRRELDETKLEKERNEEQGTPQEEDMKVLTKNKEKSKEKENFPEEEGKKSPEKNEEKSKAQNEEKSSENENKEKSFKNENEEKSSKSENEEKSSKSENEEKSSRWGS